MYKKIISVLAVFAIVSAVCAFPVYGAKYTSESTFIWGDVDFDGAVTVKDATLIQKGLAKIEYVDAVQRYIADPQGIGYSVKNATAIQKYLAKYESLASWGEEISMASQDEFSKEIPSDTSLYENNSIIVTAKSGDGEEYTIEDFKEYGFDSIEKIGGVYNPEGSDIYVLYLKNSGTENIVKAIEALEYRANLDLESVTVNGISIAD